MCQKYRLCLIRAPCQRVCGPGHTHARIYEWPGPVLGGSPGYFTPACWLGLGTRSCSGVPDPRSRFSAEWAGVEPGPHPVAPTQRLARKGEPRATPAVGEPAEFLSLHHRQYYLGRGFEKWDL